MSTRAPGFRLFKAFTPITKSCNLPLNRAIKMEKDVNGISAGVNALTASKACESVMTSFGFCESLPNRVGSSSV